MLREWNERQYQRQFDGVPPGHHGREQGDSLREWNERQAIGGVQLRRPAPSAGMEGGRQGGEWQVKGLSPTRPSKVRRKDLTPFLFGLDLMTPTNPRNIKTHTTNIGQGMKSLTPIGTLTCQADREMPFKGVSFGRERFLYDSPRLSTGEVACLTCPLRETCCRRDTKGGREVEIPITHLSHIDPGDPPMSRRFKALMRNRTSVERATKRIKLDFGDDRLKRRGNDDFQAHLDRSLIALHLLLRLKC